MKIVLCTPFNCKCPGATLSSSSHHNNAARGHSAMRNNIQHVRIVLKMMMMRRTINQQRRTRTERGRERKFIFKTEISRREIVRTCLQAFLPATLLLCEVTRGTVDKFVPHLSADNYCKATK